MLHFWFIFSCLPILLFYKKYTILDLAPIAVVTNFSKYNLSGLTCFIKI